MDIHATTIIKYYNLHVFLEMAACKVIKMAENEVDLHIKLS